MLKIKTKYLSDDKGYYFVEEDEVFKTLFGVNSKQIKKGDSIGFKIKRKHFKLLRDE